MTFAEKLVRLRKDNGFAAESGDILLLMSAQGAAYTAKTENNNVKEVR